MTESMTLAADLSYSQACAYIEDAAKLGSKPGFERIEGLCDRLGNPQDDLRFIHIAGTNGKGSTSCYIASVLAKSGIRVGMYYSPALTGIRDHFRINGELIGEADYALCVTKVATANDKMIAETGEGATQFELETAVAFTYFKDKCCDVVVLECGMGGRDDATNIVTGKICCVFTSISFDHMQYLGNTLPEIASVKAGIITSDCPVITTAYPDEVADVIRNRCAVTGSVLYTAGSKDRKTAAEYVPDILGTYQEENAGLALRAVSVIRELDLIPGIKLDDDTVKCGLNDAKWPFRFERISNDPLVIVDGAHNPDAAVKLRDTIGNTLGGYRIIMIIGMYSDKDHDGVVSVLSPVVSAFITVPTDNGTRSFSSGDMAEVAKKYCDTVICCATPEEAYDTAVSRYNDDPGKTAIIACGSLSYLDKMKRAVNGKG